MKQPDVNNVGVTNAGEDGTEAFITQSESLAINDFTGQVAVITGAASGIGLAISRRLLKEGAQVVLLDINEDGLRTEFKKYKAKAKLYPIDVTNENLINE